VAAGVRREAGGAAGSSAEDEGEGQAPRKKAKKGPAVHYQPCGRGAHCTCVICKKARSQQVPRPFPPFLLGLRMERGSVL
jgi:hypothetical protein